MKPILTLFAKRYIAGTERRHALKVAGALNRVGITATIDHLGENVKNIKDAESVVDEYASLLEDIKNTGINSNISIKLTHLGLDLSEEIAQKNAEAIIKKALALDNSVCFDMEGSAYTKKIIGICRELHRLYPNCGIAIQSALYRSAEDIRLLNENRICVRLVKGAYHEPPEIAFKDKKDVDKNFSALMKDLLLHGNMPAIATHDERLITEAVEFALKRGIHKDAFEFQMLLGIRERLQKRLADEGYRMRVYIPYGNDWLPYTLRRLRERKENLFFVLRNIFRK